MGILLKQLFAFFKLLNSETGHNQIASGLACGIILGFSPFISLQTAIVLLALFFFRIQIGAAFLSAFAFKFIAFLVDPLADVLGRSVLENESLRPFFIQLYNMPIIPLTRFNNSIVMGSGLIGLILAIPSFFIFKSLVLKYREHILARVQHTKIYKAFAATAFYKWYLTYSKLYG